MKTGQSDSASFVMQLLYKMSISKIMKNTVALILIIHSTRLLILYGDMFYVYGSSYRSYGIPQSILETRAIGQIQQKLKCLSDSWSPKNDTHPGAPIHSMPKGSELIYPNFYNFRFCDTSMAKMRVVFVLSSFDNFEARKMVRATYANFRNLKPNILERWSLFFVLGRPTNHSTARVLQKESKQFGDLIVANINDTYENLTLKSLIGIKVASCFCSNTEYVIKADDDVYLLPRKFEQVLSDLSEQTLTNEQRKNNSQARFYSGSDCVPRGGVGRTGKRGLGKDKAPYNWYKFYCYGHFYMFTMSVVKDLAVDCIHHCINFWPHEIEKDRDKYCNYLLEDVFVASCIIHMQKDATKMLNMNKTMAVSLFEMVDFRRNDSKRVPVERHIAVHGIKTQQVWSEVHGFYVSNGLV